MLRKSGQHNLLLKHGPPKFRTIEKTKIQMGPKGNVRNKKKRELVAAGGGAADAVSVLFLTKIVNYFAPDQHSHNANVTPQTKARSKKCSRICFRFLLISVNIFAKQKQRTQICWNTFRTHPQKIVGTPICRNLSLRPRAELAVGTCITQHLYNMLIQMIRSLHLKKTPFQKLPSTTDTFHGTAGGSAGWGCRRCCGGEKGRGQGEAQNTQKPLSVI